MIDVALAALVLGVCAVPVLSLSATNVRQAAVDRAHVRAVALCHDLLERFSRDRDHVRAYLDPTDRPDRFRAVDPWDHDAELAGQLGAARLADLARQSTTATLTLTTGVAPGLDLLACEVRYASHRERGADARPVTGARLILQSRREVP